MLDAYCCSLNTSEVFFFKVVVVIEDEFFHNMITAISEMLY